MAPPTTLQRVDINASQLPHLPRRADKEAVSVGTRQEPGDPASSSGAGVTSEGSETTILENRACRSSVFRSNGTALTAPPNGAGRRILDLTAISAFAETNNETKRYEIPTAFNGFGLDLEKRRRHFRVRAMEIMRNAKCPPYRKRISTNPCMMLGTT